MIADKVQIKGVWKEFLNRESKETTVALHDVDLAIGSGEFVCIVGPSGCGKTTLLRIVAGLIPPTQGIVLYDGAPVNEPSQKMGFVFQTDNLLPWRRVQDNIGFGPEIKRESKTSYRGRVDALINLVGLTGFGRHYPHQLSGGMRQRANLARALANEPDVLLMDEPFAALDAQTREIMQEELLRIWREAQKTVVFITHQIDEAIFLADRVIVMSARPGRIQEVVPVDIPRPRRLEIKRSPRFAELVDHVWRNIEKQVRASIDEELHA